MTLEELIETYPEVETYFKNMPEELKTRYTHPEISTGNHHPSERLSSGLFRDRMQRRSPGDQ